MQVNLHSLSILLYYVFELFTTYTSFIYIVFARISSYLNKNALL